MKLSTLYLPLHWEYNFSFSRLQ